VDTARAILRPCDAAVEAVPGDDDPEIVNFEKSPGSGLDAAGKTAAQATRLKPAGKRQNFAASPPTGSAAGVNSGDCSERVNGE